MTNLWIEHYLDRVSCILLLGEEITRLTLALLHPIFTCGRGEKAAVVEPPAKFMTSVQSHYEVTGPFQTCINKVLIPSPSE